MERKKSKVPEMEYAEKFPAEDLGKVVGGASLDIYICPYCGKVFDNKGIMAEMNIKWHMAQHLIEEVKS